jgi:hypothetical protein
MDTKPCRHCKQPINPAARMCQHCRSSQSWWANQSDPRFALGLLIVLLLLFVPFMYYTYGRIPIFDEPVETGSLVISDVSPRFASTPDGTRLFVLGKVHNESTRNASRIWFRVNLYNEGGKLIDSMLLDDRGLVVPSGKVGSFRVTQLLSVAQSDVARTEVVVERSGAWD